MNSLKYIHRLSKSVILIFLMFSSALYSQSTNDFRVRNDGNWSTDNDVWQFFNGTAWVNTTNYPGQTGVAVNDVVIGGEYTVEISQDINGEEINSVTVGDENSGADTLIIANTVELDTPLFIIAYDGFVTWDGNNTLELPDANTNFIVEDPDPNPAGLVLGVSHGLDETPTGNGNCNASKRINIGGTIYSACNGNPNGSVSFEDINTGGGNLNVNPTASPSPSCTNSAIQLAANPGGTEINDTPITYSWTATSPVGYTFNSTIENPSDTPINSGTYTYQVVIENNSNITSMSSVTVLIEDCNKTVITNRRITIRVSP